MGSDSREFMGKVGRGSHSGEVIPPHPGSQDFALSSRSLMGLPGRGGRRLSLSGGCQSAALLRTCRRRESSIYNIDSAMIPGLYARPRCVMFSCELMMMMAC